MARRSEISIERLDSDDGIAVRSVAERTLTLTLTSVLLITYGDHPCPIDVMLSLTFVIQDMRSFRDAACEFATDPENANPT